MSDSRRMGECLCCFEELDLVRLTELVIRWQSLLLAVIAPRNRGTGSGECIQRAVD